jgi:hypothetical protein
MLLAVPHEDSSFPKIHRLRRSKLLGSELAGHHEIDARQLVRERTHAY